MIPAMITTRAGTLHAPVLEEPAVKGHEAYRGYSPELKKWVRIVTNPAEEAISFSGLPGFPIVIDHYHDGTRVMLCEDAVRLDRIMEEERARGVPVPRVIITRFIESIQAVMERAGEKCNLSPSLVYVDKRSLQLAGAGLANHETPGLVTWISALITGDTRFLSSHDDPSALFSTWEGLLPCTWRLKTVFNGSMKDQLSSVMDWQAAFQITSPEPSHEELLASSYFEQVKHASGDWGQRACITLCNLDPVGLAPEMAGSMLSMIPAWPPSLVKWSLERKFTPGLCMSWFNKLLDRAGNYAPSFPVILDAIPALCFSEMCQKRDNIDVIGLSSRLLALSGSSPDQRAWLKKPSFVTLTSLLPAERLRFLPIAVLLLNKPGGKKIVVAPELGLTCLIEVNQMLGNSTSDQCTWEIMDAIINGISVDGRPSDIVIKLVEDLHKTIKLHPVVSDHTRLEKLASFIVHQSWLLYPATIHATGEIYDLLKRSVEMESHDEKNPYLDFAGILIIHKTSTTDRNWIILLDEWLLKHKGHEITPIVEEFKDKIKNYNF